MIKHSSVYYLLKFSLLRLVKFVLNYMAGSNMIILPNQITKCLPDVLMSYQREIKFCYRGSRIRDLIRNLQQNHSSFCDTINMFTINLFVCSKLFPRFSWISDREEGALLHIKKSTALGTRLCI